MFLEGRPMPKEFLKNKCLTNNMELIKITDKSVFKSKAKIASNSGYKKDNDAVIYEFGKNRYIVFPKSKEDSFEDYHEYIQNHKRAAMSAYKETIEDIIGNSKNVWLLKIKKV